MQHTGTSTALFYEQAIIGHLKISWTLTAEIDIDNLSRGNLIRIHVQ